MKSNDFIWRRIKDIEDSLTKEQDLLKQFEDALRYASNPRKQSGYLEDIERQRKVISKYQDEYSQLIALKSTIPESRTTHKKIDSQIEKKDNNSNYHQNNKVSIKKIDIGYLIDNIINGFLAGLFFGVFIYLTFYSDTDYDSSSLVLLCIAVLKLVRYSNRNEQTSYECLSKRLADKLVRSHCLKLDMF